MLKLRSPLLLFIFSFFLMNVLVSCGSPGDNPSSNSDTSQSLALTECPLIGKTPGVDYVSGKLSVFYLTATPTTGNNLTPHVDEISHLVLNLPADIIASSQIHVMSPADVMNDPLLRGYDAFIFNVSNGAECNAFTRLSQNEFVRGVCYLPNSTSAKCFWTRAGTFSAVGEAENQDTDGDGIPDVVDICPSRSNPSQNLEESCTFLPTPGSGGM